MISDCDRLVIHLIIHQDIEPLVKEVRDYIYNEYKTHDLTGFCDTACIELKKRLEDYFRKTYSNVKIDIKTIHGEQRHLPRLLSRCWAFEHTWMIAKINKYVIYIDPTSAQFKHFYNDIPDYYISTEAPKWYIPDNKHPVYGYKLFGIINEKIKVKVKGYRRKIGIIDYLYYEIWGKASDFIHMIVYAK